MPDEKENSLERGPFLIEDSIINLIKLDDRYKNEVSLSTITN